MSWFNKSVSREIDKEKEQDEKEKIDSDLCSYIVGLLKYDQDNWSVLSEPDMEVKTCTCNGIISSYVEKPLQQLQYRKDFIMSYYAREDLKFILIKRPIDYCIESKVCIEKLNLAIRKFLANKVMESLFPCRK